MANQFGSNPWNVDTPSNTPFFDSQLEHCQIEYVGYTGTPVAEVQDRMGKTVAFLTGLSNGMTVRSGRIGWVQGMMVPTQTSTGVANLPSGKLLIYYE